MTGGNKLVGHEYDDEGFLKVFLASPTEALSASVQSCCLRQQVVMMMMMLMVMMMVIIKTTMRKMKMVIIMTMIMKMMMKTMMMMMINFRGYNRSSQPEGIGNYALENLVEDVRGLVKVPL